MRRKKLIAPAIITIAVIFTVFMVYFIAINRAEYLLQQLVKAQSNGELIFNVDKVNLDIINLRFKFKHPELRTRDSISTVTGYHVKANSISFKAKSFIPFLLGKLIIIDSVVILNPEIEVLKYKETIKKKVSLPEEMSEVYKSLEKILTILRLDYLHIDSGKFKVYDMSSPDNKPVEITRLNLTVNKANLKNKSRDNRFLFADRIVLDVFNQDILLSDGLHGIKFKRFELNTENQTIKLDSCYIYGNQANSTSGKFSSFVDTLRISKLDLNLLANNDILKMDSALCINPEIAFQIPLNKNPKSKNTFSNNLINNDSIDFTLKKLLGNLDIGYLTIRNAKVKIVTKRVNESTEYNSSKSNFIIEKFVVNTDPKVPIRIDRFKLDVRNYVTYSPDSLYVVRFDDVQILNNKILLSNFRIGPTAANHELLSREIKMESFEFNNINWAMLLYESRIVAGNVIMSKPELYFKLPGTKKNSSDIIRQNPFTVFEEIRKKVQIDKILIHDGSIQIEDLKKTGFSVHHLNAQLDVSQLLKSTNVFRLVEALDTLTFGNGEYKSPSIQLLIMEGGFSKHKNSLTFTQIIQRNSDQSVLAKMSNVNLNGININSADNYSIEKFSWSKGDLTVNISKREKKIDANKLTSDFMLKIGNLAGGPTLLNFHGNNIEATTQINHITSGEIVIEGNRRPRVIGLFIDGQSLTLNHNQLNTTISDFIIQDKKISTLSNVIIRLPINKELVNVVVPKLIFSADIYQSINGKIVADFIELQKPVISFLPLPIDHKKKANETDGGFPLLSIGRLTIDQPKLTNLPVNLAAKMQIDLGRSNWNLLGIESNSEIIKADSIRIKLIEPNYQNDKIRTIFTGKESVSLTGSDLAFNHNRQDNKNSWSVKIDTLKSAGLRFNTILADTVSETIDVNSLNFENLTLNNKKVYNLSELVRKNDNFHVSNGNLAIQNNKTRIETFNLAIDKSTNSLTIDSISFSPLVDKYAFMNARYFRSDYIQIHTGLIKAKEIDFKLLIDNGIINSKKIIINDLHYYNYKDKRLTFQHGIEKPLLADLIKRIGTKVSFDSLQLKNGSIEYEEFNDKTQQIGKIEFSKIRGMVAGIKNIDFSPTDSIRFNLYARFMNATDLRVSYAQSFADSLLGFQLKMIAGSFDLRAINPMLKPFASALIKRGYLDTIRMSVVGQKHMAYGIMKIYYRDLKVRYLNKGIENHPTLKSMLISFFANRVVNNKKLNGSGEVYAERDPERGFVNYWVKIVIGGLFTNTGVRTDNKQEKKYYQSIEKYNVPPIRDIPVDY